VTYLYTRAAGRGQRVHAADGADDRAGGGAEAAHPPPLHESAHLRRQRAAHCSRVRLNSWMLPVQDALCQLVSFQLTTPGMLGTAIVQHEWGDRGP